MQSNTSPESARLPWVVVLHAGTAGQRVIHEDSTFAAALAYWRRLREASADVMKRQPDGFLTTEY